MDSPINIVHAAPKQMVEPETRYRRKLNKIIAELKLHDKWVYVKTLSSPWKDFNSECLAKVSYFNAISDDKSSLKFAQSQLNEPVNQDTINNKEPPMHIPTEEELKMLWQLTKE